MLTVFVVMFDLLIELSTTADDFSMSSVVAG